MLKLTLDIIGTICWIVSAGLMVMVVYNYKYIVKLQQMRIDHLYNLIGIVANGLCSSIHKGMFMDVLQNGFGKSFNKEDGYKTYQEHWNKQYQEIRKGVEKRASETDDPAEKVRLERLVLALDDSHNLLSTLSPDSSEEYAQQVMVNVAAVMNKLEED